MNEINKRMLVLRKTIGLNQEDFAQKIGIPRTTYSNVEMGKTDVSIELLKSLVTLFKANYLWLLDGTGEMFTDKSTYPSVDLHKVANDITVKYGSTEIERLTNAINDLRDSIDKLSRK